MNRREAVVATATTAMVAIAGCVFDDAELDVELEAGEAESFETSAGEDLSVTVSATDDGEADVTIGYDFERNVSEGEDVDDIEDVGERMGATVDAALSGPVLDETVADEQTFEIEIERDGYHVVAVSGASARVTIE